VGNDAFLISSVNSLCYVNIFALIFVILSIAFLYAVNVSMNLGNDFFANSDINFLHYVQTILLP